MRAVRCAAVIAGAAYLLYYGATAGVSPLWFSAIATWAACALALEWAR